MVRTSPGTRPRRRRMAPAAVALGTRTLHRTVFMRAKVATLMPPGMGRKPGSPLPPRRFNGFSPPDGRMAAILPGRIAARLMGGEATGKDHRHFVAAGGAGRRIAPRW